MTRTQIIDMRNGDLKRRGSATWSRPEWHHFNKHAHVHRHNRHGVVGGTFENLMNGFRQNACKALEKIAGMLLPLAQAFLPKRFVICARRSRGFLWQDRRWQMTWAKREEVVVGWWWWGLGEVNSSIACVDGRWRWIEWHPNVETLPETRCLFWNVPKTLQEECSLSLMLCVVINRSLSADMHPRLFLKSLRFLCSSPLTLFPYMDLTFPSGACISVIHADDFSVVTVRAFPCPEKFVRNFTAPWFEEGSRCWEGEGTFWSTAALFRILTNVAPPLVPLTRLLLQMSLLHATSNITLGVDSVLNSFSPFSNYL